MESLFNKIKGYTSLSEASWSELKKNLILKTYDDGTILSKLGEIPTKAFFFNKGLCKRLCLN